MMSLHVICGLGIPPIKNPGYAYVHIYNTLLTLGLSHSRVHRGGVEDTGSRPRPRTQKNSRPRPRTAFPRTEPLEANDRNARGQGPRTQAHVFSKKKSLQKNFSGDLQFIGVPRIFDWVGLNHKSHAMTSSSFFHKESDVIG